MALVHQLFCECLAILVLFSSDSHNSFILPPPPPPSPCNLIYGSLSKSFPMSYRKSLRAVQWMTIPMSCLSDHYALIFTPRAHAQRGVKLSVVSIVQLSIHFFGSNLLSLKIHTDRLLIEFNGLWYSLTARQVFVAIANPVSLFFGVTPCRNTNIAPAPNHTPTVQHAYSTTGTWH